MSRSNFAVAVQAFTVAAKRRPGATEGECLI